VLLKYFDLRPERIIYRVTVSRGKQRGEQTIPKAEL
jgi:hypothetical protein